MTTFWRGLYDEDAELRREFLDEIGSGEPLQLLWEQPDLAQLELPEALQQFYGGGLGFDGRASTRTSSRRSTASSRSRRSSARTRSSPTRATTTSS